MSAVRCDSSSLTTIRSRTDRFLIHIRNLLRTFSLYFYPHSLYDPLSLWASRVCECRLKGFALVRKKRGTGSLSLTQAVRREYVLSLRSVPRLALSLLSLRMECDLREHCSFPSLIHYYPYFTLKVSSFF